MKKHWIKDLEELVNINSYTNNKKGVDAVGQLISKKMLPLGYERIRHKRETIGDHLLFQSPHKPGKKILLLGHLDTVFPPNSFEGFHEDNTWVYGAGVCDMKGGLVVGIKALEWIYQKFGKIENIDFLFVSDEETGSDDSKHLTLKLAPEYDYCFVFEAAGENLEVVTSRKGVGTYTITIHGKASHAGVRYSQGINANLEASYKLQALTNLTNLDIGTTVNVGKIQGGIGANTISPECTMLLEMRFTSVSEKQRLLESLDTITHTSFVKKTSASLDGLIQRDVMEHNKQQEALIAKMETLIGQKIPIESRGGVSDANHVASCGVITLDGLGPFGDGDHTIEERALISSFEQRIKMCQEIFTYHQEHLKIL